MVVGQAKPDVAVVGGGPIGLAAAWRAAQSRPARRPCSTPASPAPGTSPPGCSRPSPSRASARTRCWSSACAPPPGSPPSAAELAEAAGEDPGLHRDAARWSSRATATRPRRSTGCSPSAARLGLEVERLLPSAARRAEPALAPTVRLALDVAGDHSVDPRRLVAALRAAVRDAGGELRDGARAPTRVTRARGGAWPAATTVAAGAVLVAAGAARPARSTRRCPCARSRARCCACATRAGPGLVDAHGPDPRRLPRPARRRPLRPRRDDGGARLGHRADRRRRVRAAARPVRGRARRARARGRGAARRPAPGDARQPARDRPRRRRRVRGRPATTATASCSPA